MTTPDGTLARVALFVQDAATKTADHYRGIGLPSYTVRKTIHRAGGERLFYVVNRETGEHFTVAIRRN